MIKTRILGWNKIWNRNSLSCELGPELTFEILVLVTKSGNVGLEIWFQLKRT